MFILQRALLYQIISDKGRAQTDKRDEAHSRLAAKSLADDQDLAGTQVG